VAAHSIGYRNQQPAIFNFEYPLSTTLLSLAATQRENQVIVLIIAPALAHVGVMGNSRAESKIPLLFAAQGR
jgi:hypothetical protein